MIFPGFPRVAAVLITAHAFDPTGLTLEDLVTSAYLNHVGTGSLRHTITNFFFLRVAVIRLHNEHPKRRREPIN
jgi:hypothetical protein